MDLGYQQAPGLTKGVRFHLYVLIDIDSRYNPSRIVAAHESVDLAAEFIEEANERNGIAPHIVHADRGTSMTSGLVSELLTNIGITRSHSQPRVSNDDPYSESQFKTLKYLHNFPKLFATLYDARVFLEGFFNEYNHIHRHSGTAWLTSASVRFGTADAVDEARQITLNEVA
ncbi:transposase [Rhodococcus qingshengii]